MRNTKLCFGTAGDAQLAPFKYRILQGAVEQFIIPNGSQEQVLLADFGIQAALTVVMVFGLDAWLRRWVSPDRALIGVLMFALILVVSYHFFLRGLSVTFEVAFMVGALWLLPCTSRLLPLPV